MVTVVTVSPKRPFIPKISFPVFAMAADRRAFPNGHISVVVLLYSRLFLKAWDCSDRGAEEKHGKSGKRVEDFVENFVPIRYTVSLSA